MARHIESEMADSEDIIYRVNDQDEIVFVNESWDRFAAANGGDAVSSSKVLHRRLWNFVVDATTREIYRLMLGRIRDGRCLQYTLRCDSPKCLRLLEMKVHCREDGTVEFHTHVVSEESRQPPDLTDKAAELGELLRVCSWCKKVYSGGTWMELEEAVDLMGFFHDTLPLSMTHGICDGCLREMKIKLA